MKQVTALRAKNSKLNTNIIFKDQEHKDLISIQMGFQQWRMMTATNYSCLNVVDIVCLIYFVAVMQNSSGRQLDYVMQNM